MGEQCDNRQRKEKPHPHNCTNTHPEEQRPSLPSPRKRGAANILHKTVENNICTKIFGQLGTRAEMGPNIPFMGQKQAEQHAIA